MGLGQWARQCGLLAARFWSHGGTGCFCELVGIHRKGSRHFERLAMHHLKDCLVTGKAISKREGDYARFKHYKNFETLQNKMSAEQRQVIEEWERRNCVPDAARF